ncbi:GNAT family N-acetyltransferase [Sinomonas sp. ASV486]|uniref:N-acetyltransferase family protein n=1 Tax=Sinomonas puerhi TaxID=3238584 RepID=A0AB39L421_9MICC|nr:GNAT family N-acetyltransferase [Sinomonas sp. ASV486]MDQ4490203.1 GNAT family N-acetyltransferase [Sinomonas sp. ASV486]
MAERRASESKPFEIADALPDDAEAILAVKDAGWREAYADLLPAEFLAGGLGAGPERTERWRGFMTPDAAGRFALARCGGRVVGFAGAGPARDDDAPAPEQLYAVYVLAEMHGTGAGRALVERVLGDRPACLWVFEDNPRARAFYAKLGFAPDGARKLDQFGGRFLAEIRMSRVV